MNQPSIPAPPDDTRQRLLHAAIEQIERLGVSRVTVRGIAAAAGANVAAVNYHFRSKEALVAAALETSIRNMIEDTDLLVARLPAAPASALGDLLAFYLEGALRFPHIAKAHLHDAFVADDYRGPFPVLFAPAIVRLRDAVRVAVPALDEAAATRRVVAALSAVLFPPFFSGLYAALGVLATPEARRAYADDVARAALAPPAVSPRGGGKRSRTPRRRLR